MLRLAQRTSLPFGARFFLRRDGCPGAQFSSLLRGGGAVNADGCARRGTVSRERGHAYSSSAGGGFSQIPPEEMARLNRTAVSLYRLLLKECRDATQHASNGGSEPLLLQPPFDLRDTGAARWLDSRESSAWPASSEVSGTPDDGRDDGKNPSRVVDFVLRWTSEAESALEEVEQDLAIRAAMLIARNIGLDHLDILPTKKSTGNGDDDNAKWEHIFASAADLSNAVRRAFLRVSSDGEDNVLRESLTKDDIVRLHRGAIDAVSLLYDQRELARCTTVTENKERGIRVVATSRFTGHSPPGKHPNNPNNGHWFAYRIRVENFRNESESNSGGGVQLLGRCFEIHELHDKSSDSDDNPTIVPAPSTGAVGHHPVIRPGQIFEYMSQMKIVTQEGKMAGKFYMAEVTERTRNGKVNEPIEALRYPKGDERLFEADVGPFQLIVPISERVDEER